MLIDFYPQEGDLTLPKLEDAKLPITVTDVTGKPIAVPEAFFKAVLLHRPADARIGEQYEAHAWIVENRSYGFSGFDQKASALEVSIDQVEAAIGLDLYPNLLRLIGAAAAEAVEAGR